MFFPLIPKYRGYPAASYAALSKLTVRSLPTLSPSYQRFTTMHLRDGKMTQPSNGTLEADTVNTDIMPYTNCNTATLSLIPLKLPTDPKTPDSMLRQIYRDFIDRYGHHSSSTRSAYHRPRRSSFEVIEDDSHLHAEYLVAAILSLKTGIAPPVAFPTETVYGLGADATNPASIAGIFAAKGRPSDNPLIVHVSSTDHLERCLGGSETESAIPEVYRDLVKEFWPGPLTILIPVPEDGKGLKFAANVHPGQKTIGFRVPSSPYARFLIAVADVPIAAPSANSSGKPSPTTARHVKQDLSGKINFILDGGSCTVGVESTVVDGLGAIPVILRPGGISKSALRNWGRKHDNIWQHVENGWDVKKPGVKRKRSEEQLSNGGPKKSMATQDSHQNGITTVASTNGATQHDETHHEEDEDGDMAAPRAPGMKYKHYAPKAHMVLFESSSSSSQARTNVEPVHAKLKELLDARDTTPNSSTVSLVQTPNGEEEWVRSPIHSLSIAILPSTSWPHLADIEKALVQGLHPEWKNEGAGSVDGHSVDDMNITSDIDVERRDGCTEKSLKLEEIELGTDAATISRNLFAALRTCDDVNCDWIFVEAPSRAAVKDVSSGHDGIADEMEDEFETVLERLRKAASEIVHN